MAAKEKKLADYTAGKGFGVRTVFYILGSLV